ncbi:hypothetical protein D7Y13_44290, partial [Corallococcus praedator]
IGSLYGVRGVEAVDLNALFVLPGAPPGGGAPAALNAASAGVLGTGVVGAELLTLHPGALRRLRAV